MKKLILILCILGICKIASAQWTTSGSDIYNTNAGNVGIGTVSPQTKFQVSNGDINMVIEPTVSAIGNNVLWTGSAYRNINTTLGSSFIQLSTDGQFGFRKTPAGTGDQNASYSMYINSSGSVGIGTASPQTKLQVSNGDINMVIEPTVSAIGNNVLWTGSAYQNINTTLGSSFIQLSTDGQFGFRKIPAGTGDQSASYSMYINSSGNVGIGTTSPSEKLSVNGKIQAKEIKVETGWSDFVFAPAYKLPDLKETEQYIKANNHLPEIPSDKEVAENGINLGEMNAKLLQKIEELTLYLIDQSKEIKDLRSEVNQLKSK